MAAIWYQFEARSNGALKPGLTPAPTFIHFKQMAAGFLSITPLPAIVEVGDGIYAFLYDAEANGEASAVVDLGAAVLNSQERFFGYPLSVDSSRIRSGIAADGTVIARELQDKGGFALAPTGLNLVEPELGVPLPLMLARMAATTAGEARYAPDGTTVTYAAMGHPSIPRVTANVTREGNRSGIAYP